MGWANRWRLIAANLSPSDDVGLRLVERFLMSIPIDDKRTVLHHEPWVKVELRGRIAGRPARVEVNTDSFHPVEVEVQCENRLMLALTMDRTKQPFRRGPPDPDWDDSRPERIFVGPAVFVEDREAPAQVEGFAKLPIELRNRIIDQMQRDKVRYLNLRYDAVWAMSWSSPAWTWGPAESITRLLGLLAEIAQTIAGIAPVKGTSKPSPRELGVKRCAYCGALCTAGVRCFHCGAPY